VLQHQLHQASHAEARVAEAAATKSRTELVIALVLVAASIALLFLRFQRQEQLMFAKQAVLQQSEERFRALTEKSADIVFITDSGGSQLRESVPLRISRERVFQHPHLISSIIMVSARPAKTKTPAINALRIRQHMVHLGTLRNSFTASTSLV
jgi:PAS domain-containing protein